MLLSQPESDLAGLSDKKVISTLVALVLGLPIASQIQPLQHFEVFAGDMAVTRAELQDWVPSFCIDDLKRCRIVSNHSPNDNSRRTELLFPLTLFEMGLGRTCYILMGSFTLSWKPHDSSREPDPFSPQCVRRGCI